METIEEIKTKKEAAIDALFTEVEGQRVQKFGAEIHTQFIEDIEASYLADLQEFKQQAELDKQQAEEAKNGAFADTTSWLNAEELAVAESSATFVREDFERLNFDEILIRGKAVLKNRNRSLAWLYLRYMPTEASTISGSIELTRLKDQLEAIVMPDEIVEAAASSADKMLDAERRRVAAAEALYVAGDGQGPFNPFQ